ncbi:MAG: hypothetical protein ACHP7P_11990 [Terriglobales bacterium]
MLPEKKPEPRLLVIDQVTVLAEGFGEAVTAERLRIYAEDLADIPLDSLAVAFRRARRELKFFPKICELRDLAGANREQQEDAEARAAWDAVVDFADKYVQSDVHGDYHISRGCRPTPPPVLSDRIVDSVRRSGGWRVYKTLLGSGNFPFLQKRFFQEYLAWERVEGVEPRKMLAAGGMEDSFRQLVAGKCMGGALPACEPSEVPTGTD